MELQTQVSGFTFVQIDDYTNALHQLKHICEAMPPLRVALLNNIKIMEVRDKNTFAKTIRLLDKMEDLIEEACGIKL